MPDSTAGPGYDPLTRQRAGLYVLPDAGPRGESGEDCTNRMDAESRMDDSHSGARPRARAGTGLRERRVLRRFRCASRARGVLSARPSGRLHDRGGLLPELASSTTASRLRLRSSIPPRFAWSTRAWDRGVRATRPASGSSRRSRSSRACDTYSCSRRVFAVNGSALVAGLLSRLPDEVTVTGGLSADGGRFQRTHVLAEGKPVEDLACAVGFYGERLGDRIRGPLGGWDAFGPERLVTKSEGNILFELDDRSALDLYKQYLGAHADGLPAAGLLFPLSVRTREQEIPVVRTILSVCEEEQSLTFAGDVPAGSYARLMKANLNRLLDGAEGAARAIPAEAARQQPGPGHSHQLRRAQARVEAESRG